MKTSISDKGFLLVWFTGHPRPFGFVSYHRTDPECRCEDVLLEFVELSERGERLREPIRFLVMLDLRNWTEKPLPDRDQAAAPFVAELLRDPSDDLKTWLRDSHERYRGGRAELAAVVLPPDDIQKGLLFSFAAVLAGDTEYLEDTAAYWLPFVHDGNVYPVEDLYCANPHCDCKEAVLSFLRPILTGQDGGGLVPLFTALLPLGAKGGRATIDSLESCSRTRAEALLGCWQREYPDVRPMLVERYNAMKEIGARSLRRGSESLRSGPATAPRRQADLVDGLSASGIGTARPRSGWTQPIVRSGPKIRPNQPCPCGSGKKYKKCCGR